MKFQSSSGLLNAARITEGYFNVPGEILARGIEIIGCGILDGAAWLGIKLKLEGPLKWLGGIVKGIFSIVAVAIKSLFGIPGGIISGLILIVGSLFTLRGSTLKKGAENLLMPTIGAVIMLVGKLVALVQTILYLQGFERPLTIQEKEILYPVFTESTNPYIIRIIDRHAGLFDITPRAFALGNTLYLKKPHFSDDLLIHEAVHSWQYQHFGSRYTIDALAAQWFVEDAYNWKKELEESQKADWLLLNMEAQAGFIEYLWLWGSLEDSYGSQVDYGQGCFFRSDGQSLFGKFNAYGKDFTLIASNATIAIRKKWM